MNIILTKLLGNSLKTVSNWKREKRPILCSTCTKPFGFCEK